jgi:TonB family protein
MQTIERFVLTFLVNSAWQTSLVVLVAACCARLMRSADARYRHIVWVTALVLGLLLPLTSTGRISGRGYGIKDAADPARLRGSDAMSEGSPMQFQAPAFTRTRTDGVRPSWVARVPARIKEPLRLPPLLIRIVLGGYLVSVLIQSVKLGRAFKLTNAIRRGAELRVLPDWIAPIVSRCEAEFGLRRVAPLYSPKTLGPVTVGARRPVIILPEGLFQASASDDLAAALCHEMAHIRRHDFAFNVLCELLYLPISFHPAARLTRRRMNETREIACDELAAGRALDASTYARSLLNIARSMSNLPSAATVAGPGYTVSVFDADILEERIMNLLNKGQRIDPRLARGSLALALVLLAASFLGAAAFSLGVTQAEQSGRVSGGASTVVGETDRPGQSGSISGMAHDPSGAVIPGAEVTLTNVETKESVVRHSGEDGAFEFPALPPTRYQLEVTAPGFARAKSADLELKPSSNLRQDIALHLGEVTQHVLVHGHKSAENPATPPPVPRRIRVGGQVESAKLIYKVQPVYPASARKRGLEGTVILQAVIGTTGQILSLSVKSDPDPILTKAARDSVSQWRYVPTLLNGAPVEVVTTIEVVFQLDE